MKKARVKIELDSMTNSETNIITDTKQEKSLHEEHYGQVPLNPVTLNRAERGQAVQ